MTALSRVAEPPALSAADLDHAARIGWEEGLDTAEIAARINEGLFCTPVVEADIANALARLRDGGA